MFVKLTFPTFQYNMGGGVIGFLLFFIFVFWVFLNQNFTDEKRDVTIYYPLRYGISYTQKSILIFLKKKGEESDQNGRSLCADSCTLQNLQ